MANHNCGEISLWRKMVSKISGNNSSLANEEHERSTVFRFSTAFGRESLVKN